MQHGSTEQKGSSHLGWDRAGRHEVSSAIQNGGQFRSYELLIFGIFQLQVTDHALILRTCGYVTFHGIRDFASLVKFRISRWEDYPGEQSQGSS